MVIDIGKGIVATRLIAPLSLQGLGLASAGDVRDWLPVACGLAAMLGHVYPLWYGLQRGQGLSRRSSASSLVWSRFARRNAGRVAGDGSWCLALSASHTIVAALSIAVVVVATGMQPSVPLLSFGIAVAVLVTYTHRSNLARMRAGTEPRSRRLWLLGRRRAN